MYLFLVIDFTNSFSQSFILKISSKHSLFRTIRDRGLNFYIMFTPHHMPHLTCNVPYVMCHMSCNLLFSKSCCTCLKTYYPLCVLEVRYMLKLAWQCVLNPSTPPYTPLRSSHSNGFRSLCCCADVTLQAGLRPGLRREQQKDKEPGERRRVKNQS